MDGSVPGIHFDTSGFCNYCSDFLRAWNHGAPADHLRKGFNLDDLVRRVKADGQGKPYDCIVGVSGGVDSSWVLVTAVRQGLRPLAVHMDNGWNSELAQNNIANLVRGLGVDLHTYVIDWVEYRGLMQAFFDADVIDIELLYDNAMLAVNYQQASRHNLRWILAGTNTSTEGMAMPTGWNWNKFDATNIQAISAHFGGPNLRTLPRIGTLSRLWYRYVRQIQWISFLDYTSYNKLEVLQELQTCFGYKPYPYKHYESVFTRFYQGYILPKKFGVDKRLLHLSTLVVSGQLSRDAALADLLRLPYPSQADLDADRAYFLKKIRWTDLQLCEFISRPPRPHTDYRTELRALRLIRDVWRRHAQTRRSGYR